MGILNVTPDSFSDGGETFSLAAAVRRAEVMWSEGADIIDVGAESTRPGSFPVSEQEEMDRLLPVVEACAAHVPLPISVDTSKARMMREAWGLGAGFINDITALDGDPQSLSTVAELGAPVCLMHMQGNPRTMQESPRYDDVVREVGAFLGSRLAACLEARIPASRILIDPGFGFGKRLEDNLRLLRRLAHFQVLGVPLLVGLSRKSFVGAVAGGGEPKSRLEGSLALGLWAVLQGARVLRVHDVGPTVKALRAIAAVMDMGD